MTCSERSESLEVAQEILCGSESTRNRSGNIKRFRADSKSLGKY